MLQLVETPKWSEIQFTHDGWKQEICLDGKQISFSEIKERLFPIQVALPATTERLEAFAAALKIPQKVVGVHCGTYPLDSSLQETFEQLKYYLAEFPEELIPFVEIQCDESLSFAAFLSLMAPLSVAPFQLIVHSKWIELFPYAFPVVGKGTPYDGAPTQRIEQAVIVPAEESPHFEKIASFIEQHTQPLRILNEREFIYSWDGVEKLYAFPETLTRVGERAIKGYEAAGGDVEIVIVL
jgi:hypothetical protein